MTTILRVDADLFRKAYGCVSSEQTRYYLNGVLVEPDLNGNGVNLIATDGHTMLVIHDERGWTDGSHIVKVSPQVLSACKPKKKDGTRWLQVDKAVPGSAGIASAYRTQVINPESFKDEDLEEIGTLEASSGDATIDGTFPTWRRVVPWQAFHNEEKTPRYLSFNAGLMARFAAVSEHVVVFNEDKGSPMFVHFPGEPRAFGIIMPMRGDQPETMPSWLILKNEEKAA